ncbi:immunoglobulin binding protein Tap42 isoform X1 [Lasioglossum baleicum]|uniref:immunoglobulin binding protein Tap42 isoform X1 n=1 Tax=Lasioglossum baleicum TaxID=434251 RepID=UPI003FCC828A
MSEEIMQNDAATLSEMFDKAFDLFNEINKTDLPTNSTKVQSDIKRAMHMLEDATRLVSVVDMFSENESFEEVATENIKYLLLPALLGTLATKLCNLDDRMHIVNVAEIYFVDFLKRVKAYGLTNVSLPENQEKEDSVRSRSNVEAITEMVSRRNTKLQRYKEQKELESQLQTLKDNLNNPNIDDEMKREYFTTLVKFYANTAIEEVSMLAAEKPILEHMKSTGKNETMGSHAPRRPKPPAAKLQPIIITRDQIQKQVYGAGYPSLPVLTVQEFYDQRVKDGDWPDPTQASTKCLQDMAGTSGNDTEQEEIKKEELLDAEDEQTLMEMRAMDEYKDTYRRGWGNRANRS